MDHGPLSKATAKASFAPFLLAAILGCGDPGADCEDLCAIEAQCTAGNDTDAIPFDEESCRATCSRFAQDDPAFADAVAERVACLEEQLDSGGGCFACTYDGT